MNINFGCDITASKAKTSILLTSVRCILFLCLPSNRGDDRKTATLKNTHNSLYIACYKTSENAEFRNVGANAELTFNIKLNVTN